MPAVTTAASQLSGLAEVMSSKLALTAALAPSTVLDYELQLQAVTAALSLAVKLR